jgi:hypothetical protein
MAVNLLVAGVAVALTVLAGELVARLFVPALAPKHGVRNFWTHDDLLGWVHVPGARGMHHHRDFDVPVANNAHGLRDDEVRFERTPGSKRLLFLGDSFGWGFGVAREQSMIELLERRHPDWEMINASVAGYGTDQQLLYFRETGHLYRPDLVLLLFHPNDVEDNNDDYRYRYYKGRFVLGPEGELVLTKVPVRGFSRRQVVERWLHQRTFLLYRIYEVAEAAEDWLRDRLEGGAAHAAPLPGVPSAHAAPLPGMPSAHAAPLPGVPSSPDRSGRLVLHPPPLPPPPVSAEKREDRANRRVDPRVTRALVAVLAQQVRAEGAELLVVSVPGWPDPRPVLGDVLDAVSVPYLPLDPFFVGRPREAYKFEHDPHWNAGGHAIAAEAVDAWLEQQGLLEGGSPRPSRGP